MSDFQIDFGSRPNSTRPAAFSVEIAAGIMTHVQHWAPAGDGTQDIFSELLLQIYVNGNLCFNGDISDMPSTFTAVLDGDIDNQIKFWAKGMQFLPTGQDIRAGFILTDMTVEQCPIIEYLDRAHTHDTGVRLGLQRQHGNQGFYEQLEPKASREFPWPICHCDQYSDPVVLVENGWATLTIVSPVYKWLLNTIRC